MMKTKDISTETLTPKPKRKVTSTRVSRKPKTTQVVKSEPLTATAGPEKPERAPLPDLDTMLNDIFLIDFGALGMAYTVMSNATIGRHIGVALAHATRKRNKYFSVSCNVRDAFELVSYDAKARFMEVRLTPAGQEALVIMTDQDSEQVERDAAAERAEQDETLQIVSTMPARRSWWRSPRSVT